MRELQNKLENSENPELKDAAYTLNADAKSLYNTISSLSNKSLAELFKVEPNLIALAVSFGTKEKRERAEEIFEIMRGKDYTR
tara:strand:- start:269 stop:517 length:249 start_codon:yes stop_codon:yes gene_type:complete